MYEKMRIVVVCLLLVLLVSGANAEEKPWFGTYRNVNIPGYEIGKTELLTSEFSGPQREGVYIEILNNLRDLCVKVNGVALVNVTLTPAIGDKVTVRDTMKPWQTKVYSPGLHVIGLADCVLKVDKISR